MRKVAFFDVDGTIIDGVCISAFATFIGERNSVQQVLNRPLSRSALNRRISALFRGYDVNEISEAAAVFFKQYILPRLNSRVITLMESLRMDGYELALVSGSPEFVLGALGRYLQIDHVFGLALRFSSRICTGEIIEPRPLGRGKEYIVREFCAKHNISLSDCVACGDHISDQYLLRTVGRAFVTGGDRQLNELAFNSSWTLI